MLCPISITRWYCVGSDARCSRPKALPYCRQGTHTLRSRQATWIVQRGVEGALSLYTWERQMLLNLSLPHRWHVAKQSYYGHYTLRNVIGQGQRTGALTWGHRCQKELPRPRGHQKEVGSSDGLITSWQALIEVPLYLCPYFSHLFTLLSFLSL